MERKEIHSERKFEFAGPTVTMNNIERELRRVITKARLITYDTSLPLISSAPERPPAFPAHQTGRRADSFH
jgi:bifunctional non-homologous end joining protein LigD